MGIYNYLNLSELMNEMLLTRRSVSVRDLVEEGLKRRIVLATEFAPADRYDLENAFIDLVDALYHRGAIKPVPANETESTIIAFYESGKLAEQGYGGEEGDRFIEIKWIAITDDLPVIVNL